LTDTGFIRRPPANSGSNIASTSTTCPSRRRHHRRSALCPTDICRVRAKAVRAGGEPAGRQIQSDDELKVHGLRVIDASVIPAVTSTNTNTAAIIKGAARQRMAA
jgi:hypothetical protein